MIGIGIATQAFVSRFWWQIPLVVAVVLGVLRWDYKRIERHVDAGKKEVVTEIRSKNDKAVDAADRARDKSKRVLAVPGNVDPHASSSN